MSDLCAFCLSNNRNLYSIQDEHWLSFSSILDDEDHEDAQYMKYLQSESLLKLCWECQARLDGFSKFVRSAQASVNILRHYWACPTELIPSSLSKLYQTQPETIDVAPSQAELTADGQLEDKPSDGVGEQVKIEFDLSQRLDSTPDKFPIKLEHDDVDKESLLQALAGPGIQDEADDDDDQKSEGVEEVMLSERRHKKTVKKKVKAAKSTKPINRTRKKTTKAIQYDTIWMSDEQALKWYQSERDAQSGGHESERDAHSGGHESERDAHSGGHESERNAHSGGHESERDAHSGGHESTCEQCGRRVAESEVLAHAECHSESAGSYICDMCQHRFRDQPTLQRHMARHYTLYKCRLCEYETPHVAHMAAHDTHTAALKGKGASECKKCKITFKNASLLRKHRSKCNLFKCDFCEKAFVHRTSKYSHMDLHHKPLPQVECKVCGKQFKNKYAIKSHLQKHRKEARGGNYTCTICEVDYKTAIAFRQHFYKTVRIDGRQEFRNECAHCEIKFSSPKRLQEHISKVHAKKATYRCDKCHKSYMQKKALELHVANKHVASKPARDKICDVCGKRFTSTTILRNHMRSHTGEKPYKCTLCGAAFAHTGSLYTHNKLLHKKKKMQDAHVDMEMYHCSECSKEFVSEARWRSHYDFFHLKKSKYACEICNKIFISAWNLKNHRTMLHGINRTRSFPCNTCGKEFFRIDALKSHKLIHSEERTFMCSECGKTFKQQAALYTHTKLVHKGIKRPPAKPSSKRVKKPTASPQMELESKFV